MTALPIVVVADTNVLFSRVLRDHVMYAALEGLVALRWSESILDELERTLVERRKLTLEQASRLRMLMTRALPDATVTPSDHDRARVATLALPDVGDRHVLATAIAAGANMICTTNLRDFPAEATGRVGINTTSPDDLLCALIVAVPTEMARVHAASVAGMPHSTPEHTLNALIRGGAPRTAAALRALS